MIGGSEHSARPLVTIPVLAARQVSCGTCPMLPLVLPGACGAEGAAKYHRLCEGGRQPPLLAEGRLPSWAAALTSRPARRSARLPRRRAEQALIPGLMFLKYGVGWEVGQAL